MPRAVNVTVNIKYQETDTVSAGEHPVAPPATVLPRQPASSLVPDTFRRLLLPLRDPSFLEVDIPVQHVKSACYPLGTTLTCMWQNWNAGSCMSLLTQHNTSSSRRLQSVLSLSLWTEVREK